MAHEVERIDADALAARGAGALERDAPLVIEGSVGGRVREELWSPEALRGRVGARRVSVTRADSGSFDYTPEGEPHYSYVNIPFAEALEVIASSSAPGPCYYLRRVELAELGLGEDGLPEVFDFVPRGVRRIQGLWVSSEGSVTPLHYDTKNNLLAQMHGTKRVTLFPSSEGARMYPQEFTGTNLLSGVDPDEPDRARFPNFPSERALRLTLKPGETLYVPPFWWHHVRSREFSVSVNLFWQTGARQCLVENSAVYLRERYKHDRLAEFFADDGDERPRLFAELAADARARGLSLAATLFCGAAAHLMLNDAEGLAGRGRERAEVCAFTASLAATRGVVPKDSELERMVSGVAELASARDEDAAQVSAPAALET